MKTDQPEMMSKSSRDALQQIVVKRSKKKAHPLAKIDFVAIFLIVLVVFISIFTLPDDWNGVSTQHVWYYGWITAVSTGIGVLPFFFFSEPDKFWMGISNGKSVQPSRIVFDLVVCEVFFRLLSVVLNCPQLFLLA